MREPEGRPVPPAGPPRRGERPAPAVASQGSRIALHVLFAFVPLFYLWSGLSRWWMLLVCLPAVAGIGLDLWRISSPRMNESVLKYWGHLFKEGERVRLTGSSHYFMGMMGAVLLYPKPVAVCASLYMAWADPAAVVVGRRFGRRPLGDKTWEGCAAFVATAFAVGLFFFSWPVALAGAVAAGLVELFTPRWANDNSLIPVAAGLLLALLG